MAHKCANFYTVLLLYKEDIAQGSAGITMVQAEIQADISSQHSAASLGLRVNLRSCPVDLEPGIPVRVQWFVQRHAQSQFAGYATKTTIIFQLTVRELIHYHVIYQSPMLAYDQPWHTQLQGFSLKPSSRYQIRVVAYRCNFMQLGGEADRKRAGVEDINQQQCMEIASSAWVEFGSGPGSTWQATPIWASPSHLVLGNADADTEHVDYAALAWPQQYIQHSQVSHDSFFANIKQQYDTHNAHGWAFIRSEFELENQPIIWATLNLTAASGIQQRQFVHKTWVNGTLVGIGPTASIQEETRYDGFDVTQLLHQGVSNAIGALVYTLEDQRYCAQLEICYADGHLQTFGTDASWKTMPGLPVFDQAPSIGTQYFEAPAEYMHIEHFPVGFSMPGFDDSAWQYAVEKPQFAQYSATPTEHISITYHHPVSLHLTHDSIILDCGQTYMGGISLDTDILCRDLAVLHGMLPVLSTHTRTDSTKQVMLSVRYGEVLQKSGDVQYQLSTGNTYQDYWHLPVRGSGQIETWGIRVFRYIQLHIPLDAPYTIQDLYRILQHNQQIVRIAAIQYPMGAQADEVSLQSSNDLLQQIWQFCAQTITALNGPIYADSWTRERAPYEADAWLQQRAHAALDYSPSLGIYSIDYLLANRTWPTEWPLYSILAVYDAWMNTADTTQMTEQYTKLVSLLPERYIDSQTGLLVKLPGNSSEMDGDLVDWPPSERDNFVFTCVNTVVNSLASAAYEAMGVMAQHLGYDADAVHFQRRASVMRQSLHEYCYDEQRGVYVDGITGVTDPEAVGSFLQTESGAERQHRLRITHSSEHANAFVLAFAQPPIGRVANIVPYIRSKAMACSVYSAAVLLQGLFESGYGYYADDLILANDPLRSWSAMMGIGAGSTMEAWSLQLKGNTTYSHPWAASPVWLISRYALGVQAIEPGFRVFRVQPQLGETIHDLSGAVPTPYGEIRVSLHVDDCGVTRGKLCVPAGTSAIIDGRTYCSGEHNVTFASFLR